MELKIILQIVGTLLGLLYLWLEYRVNIWLWVVGAVMPVVHGLLYFNSGLYADATMQLYYVAAGIYGLMVWRRKAKSDHDGRVMHTPKGWIAPLVATYLVLHAVIYCVLVNWTDSTVPVFDAMTTAMSIVAMWMLSRKLVEQWLVWLVVDMITVGLYVYKGIPISAGLYAVYCVLAVVGYIRWRKLV